MRKGLQVTLSLAILALFSTNALAIAPAIDPIPDLIVGDAENSSANNAFVYPDAVDLDLWSSDDDDDPEDLIYSYDAATPTRYTINGVQPLDGDDPLSPPAGKRLNAANDNDPFNQFGVADLNPRTITVRDELRSPAADGDGGITSSYPDPAGGPGILPDDRVITLYVSDGTTVRETMLIVYTEDDGPDGFSPRENVVNSYNFREGMEGWSFESINGTVSGTQDSELGLCLEVPGGGDNDGQWVSPYGAFELMQDTIWEARITVATDQETPGATPVWEAVYENISADGFQGQNAFGGEYIYFDNEGSANSPIPGIGRSNRFAWRFYMTPIAFQVAHFNDTVNGFYNPALDDDRGARVRLRILDNASGGYGADSDFGAVCFKDYKILSHDFTDMNVVSTEHDVDTFTEDEGTTTGEGQYHVNFSGVDAGTDATYTGGDVILSPTDGNWNDFAYTQFLPGDDDIDLVGGTFIDNYPVELDADSLYYVEFELSAPTQSDEENPPDVVRVRADNVTFELSTQQFVAPFTPDLSGGGAAPSRGLVTPREGAPQKYALFFYSHSLSNTGLTDANRMRGGFEIICTDALNPQGRISNTGSVQVHSALVQKVEFN